MATTTAYPPVTVDGLPRRRQRRSAQELADAIRGSLGEIIPTPPAVDALHDEHPAFSAWIALEDAAMDEVVAKLPAMLLAAVEARLPWTWEPER